MLRVSGEPSKNIPLKEVNIIGKISSLAGDVTIVQLFQNEEQMSIEAVYCFPIEKDAAVYSFTAKIDDREMVAQLKEKKEAQYEYSNALRQGHGAYLLEQDEQSQDCFIINIGALPSGKQCEIKISYVTELQLVNDGKTIRFVIPTTIAPRYNPSEGRISSTVGGTRSQYTHSAPYTIELKCQIDKLAQQVSQISSPSHPINVDLSNEEFYQVNFAQKSTHLDRDIILDIQLSEARSNTLLAVQNNTIMAVLTPTEEDCKKALGMDVGEDISNTNEFIFVIDCSGSMTGNKIDAARQAMLIFLKSLPVSCRFNIIQFGSHYRSLFENEVTAVYNEKAMNEAQEMIKMMQADLGGTELLEPLQYLHSKPPSRSYSRQIFLLTDGEVSNENEVLDLCRSMSTTSRIFSFGLGHSPSRSLVKGLACTTNGFFVFIPPNAPVDVYVAQQLEKAFQPCITNVQAKWNQTGIETAPTKVPPVYANNCLIFYGLLHPSSHFEHDITVSLYKTDNNILLGQAKVNCIPSIIEDQTISRLAAKAFINELLHAKTGKQNIGSQQTRFQQKDHLATFAANENDQRKQQIIDLSLKYSILSPYTSFLAIEKRLQEDNTYMVLREVPIQISPADQHLFQQPQRQSQADYSFVSRHSIYNSNIETMSRMTVNCRKTTCYRGKGVFTQDSQNGTFNPRVQVNQTRIERANNRAKNLLSGEVSFRAVDKFSSISTEWPTDEKDIVRYLIDLQKFDGLWFLSDEQIEKLMKQPLSSYRSQYTADPNVLSSALVLITLEQERFQSFKTLWQACVKKTKHRLAQLLGGHEKLELVLQEMREQTLNSNANDMKTTTTTASKWNFLARFWRKISK